MDVETRRDDANYDHGGPKHRGSRLDGEMHGPWEFYRRDGSLMRSGEFDRGRQVGTWRTTEPGPWSRRPSSLKPNSDEASTEGL